MNLSHALLIPLLLASSLLPAPTAQELVRQMPFLAQQAYLTASNAGEDNYFGFFSSVAISGDTMVVSAWREESGASGVNGDQLDDSAPEAGAAYVFVRNGHRWVQQAYLKASNPEPGDIFGSAVAIDGDTIVIGALAEDSAATGVDGNQTDNSAEDAGAAYVFVRQGTNWSQQAYLKASNTDAHDFFGLSVAISGDTLVVGAEGEASLSRGVNSNQRDNRAPRAGAAYVFVRQLGTWRQQAYLKASNTDAGDDFGGKVAIYGDTIAIASDSEDSAIAGINGDQNDNTDVDTGAVYIFTRTGSDWSQQAYLKASNPTPDSDFGEGLALFADTLVVGAPGEAGNGIGVNGLPTNYNAGGSGAAYIYVRQGTRWQQEAYLKASNAESGDGFGRAVGVWRNTVVVGAWNEDGAGATINQNAASNGARDAGAAYVFVQDGFRWKEQAYLKPFNPQPGANFGAAVAVSGDTVSVGSYDDRDGAGSVYVFTGAGPEHLQARPSKRVVVSWDPSQLILTPETANRLDRPWLIRFEGELGSVDGRAQITLPPLGPSQFFRFTGDPYYYADPQSIAAPVANPSARVRCPTLSSNGLTLYYCTDVSGEADLYQTTRPTLTSPWGTPVPLSAINTSADEAFPAISSDGLSLFFTDWFLFLQRNNRPESWGRGDLYLAYRRTEKEAWQTPLNLGDPVNTEFQETTPNLSADGRTLLFASNRPGTLGFTGDTFDYPDLWMTTRTNTSPTNAWSFPVNLGPIVNSYWGEYTPFLSADGLTLFFNSSRPSPSGHDGYENIWVSRRASITEPFGAPVSLGPYFTDFFHLVDPCLSSDGTTLFFASRGYLSDTVARFGTIWNVKIRPLPALSIRLE